MSLDLAEAVLAPADQAAPAKETTTRTKRSIVPIVTALTLALLLGAWQVAATLKLVSPVFLPAPIDVAHQFVTVARDGFVDATLLQHLLASLGRVFAALLAATLVAVPIGFAIGSSPIGRGIFDPLIEILRPIPPLAYLPLVIIWFGISEPSKILIIGIAMLAPIVIATATGVKGVATDRLNAARALGATKAQLLRHVVLPSALPSILVGIRIALGTGWSTLVAAELVAASRGLGFMIQSAAQFLVTDVVIMGILVIAAVAFAFEAAIRLLERWLVPWAGKA
ncbi:ABC transporter permease subunit [Kaistia dalseonensis]|uniref:Taurine transport system permease protein n=1 Tax=Kaistia dalseonensis TaxID=410840 RepID=A0ABU0H6D2_9HYPH|nr:ABC transporter permease subunit [Kaistia dalseonensis]MCX5495286.1 ABC transporter permease subunit [Kaistia dalseonensis]MDQ0437872.1 taurine transport system permease protein [Kaistia dalseonensis]